MSSANNTKKVRVIIRSSNWDKTRGGMEGRDYLSCSPHSREDLEIFKTPKGVHANVPCSLKANSRNSQLKEEINHEFLERNRKERKGERNNHYSPPTW
jgi:hypothetical protein